MNNQSFYLQKINYSDFIFIKKKEDIYLFLKMIFYIDNYFIVNKKDHSKDFIGTTHYIEKSIKYLKRNIYYRITGEYIDDEEYLSQEEIDYIICKIYNILTKKETMIIFNLENHFFAIKEFYNDYVFEDLKELDKGIFNNSKF